MFLNQLKKKRHKEKTSYGITERGKIIVQGDREGGGGGVNACRINNRLVSDTHIGVKL